MLWVTDLIEDIRRLVSFVNWHLTFLLEHSEQLDVSVASHYKSDQHLVVHSKRIGMSDGGITDFHLTFSTSITAWILPPLPVRSFLCLETHG